MHLQKCAMSDPTPETSPFHQMRRSLVQQMSTPIGRIAAGVLCAVGSDSLVTVMHVCVVIIVHYS